MTAMLIFQNTALLLILHKQILPIKSIYALHIVCNILKEWPQNVYKKIFTVCFWPLYDA